ncbi:hypothetical protein VA7868_03617 [Vibrio aerogenes CECT 7868]|uniref:Lipoprotein n=1 Tax=Vibrio aerogenes CECT 7868 TaxID=1216006 RepID=A0A1M6AMV8_9VIBR|nr:DUF6694 family lipoprotein [Vibrio aerogenes]SHI37771.1 hypothetical protein VA7868_03617 [Vibrio aerogenes CECT 7868]
MINKLRTLFLMGSMSLLTACGDPSMNTSSPEKMQSSVQEILDGLNPAQKAEFTHIIIQVYKQAMVRSLNQNGTLSLEDAKKEADQKLNGLNAAGVFSLSKQ